MPDSVLRNNGSSDCRIIDAIESLESSFSRVENILRKIASSNGDFDRVGRYELEERDGAID